MDAWAIAGLIVLLIVAWLGFWVALISMIGRLGGWRQLAKTYPLQVREATAEIRHPLAIDPASDRSIRRSFALQSVFLGRFTNYNNVVHFTVRDEGLALSVMKIFSFGHPPILLPWNEMKVTPTTGWVFKMVKLEMRQSPGTTITITQALAKKLASAAGEDWPKV